MFIEHALNGLVLVLEVRYSLCSVSVLLKLVNIHTKMCPNTCELVTTHEIGGVVNIMFMIGQSGLSIIYIV
jgi:hypothetical protein